MASLQTPAYLTAHNSPTRARGQARAHRSFLHLTPEPSRPETLHIDLPLHDPSIPTPYDATVIGCGPSGLRLAERAAARGLKVCCIDPSPLSTWPNNYGAWLDELEPLGLDSSLDFTWPSASILIDDNKSKRLNRPYGRINGHHLKSLLMNRCADLGVRFHVAKAWTVDHEEFRSTVACSDGGVVKSSLVVDAGGFGSRFVDYDAPIGSRGFQIAHGILAEVDGHPFDLDRMLLMDWRSSHLDNEPYLRASNESTPSFLYAMPFDSNLIFLEETSLVSRPAVPYSEIKKRMAARLRHLGIEVRRVIEEEKCLIPMGGPLPRIPQAALGFGGAGGLVHPATGYMAARSLAVAGTVADEMAECLGSTRMIRGRALQRRVWGRMWTADMRRAREYYCFGMETLLKLDLKGTRSFFDAFFDLEPRQWHGFLSSRLSLRELAELSLDLFGHASGPSKLDIVTKCPLPLAKMMANLALQSI